MNQEANRAAHGLAVEERGQALKLGVLFDKIEEAEAVVDYRVNIGDESLEALGSAMAFEVKGEASEAGSGEEDGGGLESPADVVAVAMDHEDEGSGRGGREGKP